jgi:hypothetical protein
VQLLGTSELHRVGVQLDDLDAVLHEPVDQRPVVVPGRFDTDPAHHR